MSLTRVGIRVYPGTHLNRIPYTHSGRIRARGYLGISSYPLKPNSIHPLTRVVFGGHGWVGGWTSHIYLARWMTICDIPESAVLLENFWALMPFLPSCEGAFGRVGIWVYPACWARMPFCPLFKGGFGQVGIWVYPDAGLPLIQGVFWKRGYLGIPSYPLKSTSIYPLRSNSCEWVVGYTQLPT